MSARSIEGLGLNVEAARQGRTWLLLPQDYQERADTYPLPLAHAEIQILALIPIPPKKRDSGCTYLKRCQKRFKEIQRGKQSKTAGIERQEEKAFRSRRTLEVHLARLRERAEKAVSEVEATAQEAIASLDDLFSLGRQGLHGMMKAHLNSEEWKGESISAAAFRDCFRMVSQTVKGLGLPSGERDKAREAVLDQIAASLKSTQAALAMGPGAAEPPPGKEN